MITYGNFIRMNTKQVRNEIITQTKPTANSRIRFNLGVILLSIEFVRSNTTNPNPPRENKKLEASPSIIYCPLTLYGMKATGRECPCSSVVDPTLGGSIITS